MRYHLDTDFLVYALSGPERKRLRAMADSDDEIQMSAVAWYEFSRGPGPPSSSRSRVGHTGAARRGGWISFCMSPIAECLQSLDYASTAHRCSELAGGDPAVTRERGMHATLGAGPWTWLYSSI
jgi:hypothetical protein